MTECTADECSNEAEFGLWLSETDDFSRVVGARSESRHSQGDLHPFVCADCRPRYAAMFQLGEFKEVSDDDA